MLDSLKETIHSIKEIGYVFGLLKEKPEKPSSNPISNIELEDHNHNDDIEVQDLELHNPWDKDPFAYEELNILNNKYIYILKSELEDLQDEYYFFEEVDLDEDQNTFYRAFCEIYNSLLPGDPLHPEVFYHWLHSILPEHRSSMLRFYAEKRENQLHIATYKKQLWNIRLKNPQGVSCTFADLPDQELALN